MSIGENSDEQNGDFQAQDIWVAWRLLTRVPLPVKWGATYERAGQAAWAYPLVGLGIGLICGFVLWLMTGIGLHAGVAAALTLGLGMLLTGALHEDGLSDTADGLGGGRDKAHILEIMRDSRVGAFGIAALAIGILARWSALAALANAAPLATMILAACVSRMPMVLVMAALPHARSDGLSVLVGRPNRAQAFAALALASGCALVLCGLFGIVMILVVLLAVVPVVFWASRQLGGQTGDILGAVQQSAEIAALAMTTIVFL